MDRSTTERADLIRHLRRRSTQADDYAAFYGVEPAIESPEELEAADRAWQERRRVMDEERAAKRAEREAGEKEGSGR